MRATACARALAMMLALGPALPHAVRADDAAPSQPPKPYPEGITCVFVPSLDRYSLIDDAHIVFTGPNKTAYLATLTRRCLDLDTSLDVKIVRTGPNLCSGDAIMTENDRCTIRYLEPVADYADAKAIVAARESAEKAARQHN